MNKISCHLRLLCPRLRQYYTPLHIPSFEIRGSFASLTRDQFACVQFSCSTTTPAPRDFFMDAREGDSPGPSELPTFLCVPPAAEG